MADYFEGQSQAAVHEGDFELDPNITSKLPVGAVILTCKGHGASNWNKLARIDMELRGAEKLSYFLKIATGDLGRGMIHGEYESMKAVHNFTPLSAPVPIAWGTSTDLTHHFILLSFHEFEVGLPSIPCFTEVVAQLHSRSNGSSPNGKFGFHLTTYNGTLAQDNNWTDTWEEFYKQGMERMFKLEEEARGMNEELRQLSKPFLTKVIPRLLRPMESFGRKVVPVLIHGDLWVGNVSTDKKTEMPLMFDASAFWGHNEYELSTMRLLHNDWGHECIESYHKRIPKSEPEEDWESRNALYSIRTIIHDSALYPTVPKFRTLSIEEMRKLVEQYPDGYVEVLPPHDLHNTA